MALPLPHRPLVLSALLWLGSVASVLAQTPSKNFALNDFDGVRHELSAIVAKNDVTLLSFWASWCLPCQQELQELNAYLAKEPARVAVVAVNIDLPKDLMKARRFAAQKKLSFVLLHDLRGDVKQAYGVEAIPRLFILDRKGRIQAEHRGYKDFRTIEDDIARVAALPKD